MVDVTGGCACGAVRWRSPGPILWAGHCHCDSCRKATASPMTSFFGVPRETLDLAGPLGARYSSDGSVRRQYCKECGAQVTYQWTGWPNETHLYAAGLDDPTQFVPEAHFHYAERLPWLTVSDELPKYPGSANTTDPQ